MEAVESPSLEVSKRLVEVALRALFSPGLGSVRLIVGLSDTTGVFSP